MSRRREPGQGVRRRSRRLPDLISPTTARVFVKRRAEMWLAVAEARELTSSAAFRQWLDALNLPRDSLPAIGKPRNHATPPLS
jgi:hypothetical protein